MFLEWPSTKIAKMVLLSWTKWPSELKIEKKLLKTSPLRPMTWFQNNFTEMFLLWPFTKIAKMVPFGWTKWPPELKKEKGIDCHVSINNVQVSPVITRWSRCTNPDHDIGEARSNFGADWSDFINVDICMGHTYIHVWRDLWMKTMIFHVLFI